MLGELGEGVQNIDSPMKSDKYLLQVTCTNNLAETK